MNVKDCVEQLAQRFDQAELFYGHGTDNAWDEAIYLVFTVLGLPFGADSDVSAQEVTAEQWQVLDALATRRVQVHTPVAYLVNEAWFAGLAFFVDSRVLIPRSPIAELIAEGYEPLLQQPPSRVLDLCTGSGCIGIATALCFPEARVELADISPPALEVARHNIERHGLGERVTAHESDLFAALTGTYDLIVSNPPYVSAEEVADLPAEYRQEPALGLLSDDEGLAIPLQILRQAADYLSEQGLLVLELGYSWSLLAQRYPQLPVMWLDFENGGEGVLAISRAALIRAQAVLRV